MMAAMINYKMDNYDADEIVRRINEKTTGDREGWIFW